MRYVPALDGIRALAVLLVLGFHSQVPGFGAGFFGVDVFFVLSGYLITQILVAEHERTGRIDLTRFYVRRLRRLYPAMLAMLGVFLLIAPFLFVHDAYADHLRDAGMSVLYLADYARTLGMPPMVLDHMWSLSVEEHFYLAWPLLLIGLLRLPRRWAAASIAGLFVAVTLWRYASIPDVGWKVYHRFDTHSSGLFLGCLLGLLRARLPGYFAWLGLALLALAPLEFAHKTEYTMAYGFTFAEIAAALIVTAQPKWLGWSPLAWLGRMSYGTYLWHYLFMRIARDAELGWEWNFAVSLAGGVAMAALSYYTIEAYFRRRSLPVDHKLDVVHVPVEVGARATGGVIEDVEVARA